MSYYPVSAYIVISRWALKSSSLSVSAQRPYGSVVVFSGSMVELLASPCGSCATQDATALSLALGRIESILGGLAIVIAKRSQLNLAVCSVSSFARFFTNGEPGLITQIYIVQPSRAEAVHFSYR